MEVTNRLLFMAFSVIVFCIAVFFLIAESHQYRTTLSNIRNSYKDANLYEQFNTNDEEIVPYAKLMVSMFDTLEYDITIIDTDKNMEIDKNNYDPNDIDLYNVKETSYQKRYVYDRDGDITRIVYTEITG